MKVLIVIIGFILIWGGIIFLLLLAHRRDKKAKIKAIEKYAEESINNISFIRIDDARYVMYGSHFKVNNPIAKKKKLFKCKGDVLEGFVLKCRFEQVEDTVIYTDTILGTYIGYNRFDKWMAGFLRIIESIVAGVSFYMPILYEQFSVKWIFHIIYIVLFVVNFVLTYYITLFFSRKEIMTIVRTTEGDYSVGDIYVGETVRKLLPEKTRGEFSIEQVNGQ